MIVTSEATPFVIRREFSVSRLLLWVILIAWCCGTSIASEQADVAREKRLAEQIVDAIIDGEADYIESDGHAFLGIYTATEAAEPKGAVLILHGRGFHPDWQDAIQPLRVGLVAHGWNTLSIQMPVLEKTAKYFDYLPLFPNAAGRIEAAIDYLQDHGNELIAVLAHSCGFHMANHWLNTSDSAAAARFDAFVGVGMGATDYRQPMQEPYALETVAVPVLDIFGENDYPAVLRTAPERKQMIDAAGHPKSRQVVVPEADHYFKETGDALVEAVAAWLATL